jgi:hypothetical protein
MFSVPFIEGGGGTGDLEGHLAGAEGLELPTCGFGGAHASSRLASDCRPTNHAPQAWSSRTLRQRQEFPPYRSE